MFADLFGWLLLLISLCGLYLFLKSLGSSSQSKQDHADIAKDIADGARRTSTNAPAYRSRPTPAPQYKQPHGYDSSVSMRVTIEPLDRLPERAQSLENIRRAGDKAWVPNGRSIQVADIMISGGLIFVGKDLPARDGWRTENCLIRLDRQVSSSVADFEGHGMPYWPNYGEIAPECRRAYLLWLAGERADPGAYVGYVFLYFYGLERRFFLERAKADAEDIIGEVKRLRDIYGHNRSFHRYATAFLNAATILEHGDDPSTIIAPDMRAIETAGSNLVAVALGTYAANDTPIPADWMVAWYLSHPETRLRTAARRVPALFARHLKDRWLEKYPDGYPSSRLGKKSRQLSLAYHAASSTFRVDLLGGESKLPDVTHLKRPINEIGQLAEKLTDELDAFSRYLGRNLEKRESFMALALLPAAIARSEIQIAHPGLLARLQDLAEKDEAVSLKFLVELVEADDRYTPAAIRKLADALSMVGIGFVPDPRFSFLKAAAEDEVHLFSLPTSEGTVGKADDAYKVSLLVLSIGALVALADGVVADEERRTLNAIVDQMEGISSDARARLKANVNWMLSNGLSWAKLRKRVAEADVVTKEVLAQLAIKIAAVDGHIDPSEVSQLEKLYTVLDLPADQLYSDIHKLPVSAPPQSGAKGTAHAANAPRQHPTSTNKGSSGIEGLDQKRIQAVIADTHAVSDLLSEIFVSEEEEAEAPQPSSERALSARYDGLTIGHEEFLTELLSRPRWTGEEFARLASQFDLMPNGVLEEMNEWSLDTYDDLILEEDGDKIRINEQLAAELQEVTQ